MDKAGIVLPLAISEHYGARIQEAASNRVGLFPLDTIPADVSHLESADIILHDFVRDSLQLADVMQYCHNVKWLHSTSAGIDEIAALEWSPDTWITNSGGIYAPAMAEYAVWAMVMSARGPRQLVRAQQHHQWSESSAGPETWAETLASFGSELYGKQVGIIGYGVVGRQVASVCKALGMRVWATRRTPIATFNEPLDRSLASSDSKVLLEHSDFVILTASLNSTTRGLIGSRELSDMKDGAVLINLGRGELIDQPALIEALRNGHLAGAVLDVATPEPLQPEDDLWKAPNVWITPHVSGNTRDGWQRVIDLFCSNLGIYLDGHPERMANLVNLSAHA